MPRKASKYAARLATTTTTSAIEIATVDCKRQLIKTLPLANASNRLTALVTRPIANTCNQRIIGRSMPGYSDDYQTTHGVRCGQ